MNIVSEGDHIYVFPLPPGVYDILVKVQQIAQPSSYRSELKSIARSLLGGDLIVLTPVYSNGFDFSSSIGNFKIEDIKKFVRAYNKEVGYVQHYGCFTVDSISKLDEPTILQILGIFNIDAVKKKPNLLTARWNLLDILSGEEDYLAPYVKKTVKHHSFKEYMTCHDSVVVEKYRSRRFPVFVPMDDFLRRYLLVVCDIIETEETQKLTNKPFKKTWYVNHRHYLEPLMHADPRLGEYFDLKGMSYKMAEIRAVTVAKELGFDDSIEETKKPFKKNIKSSSSGDDRSSFKKTRHSASDEERKTKKSSKKTFVDSSSEEDVKSRRSKK